MKHSLPRFRFALLAMVVASTPALAAEHVTLRNGSEFDCTRQEAMGDRIRLYLLSSARPDPQSIAQQDSYIEVAATSVVRVETMPGLPVPVASVRMAPLAPYEIREMLTRAGAAHNIDADLLASVVQAESAGNPLAVSRAGARGLMQLMPATASSLNVRNSFAPEDNIGGGTAYLDLLLTRYRDNIALALAAYNAGPAAVDRYHGIPPFAETRAYVARVIRAFNRRKIAAASLGVVTAAH